jgi:hypothetical protein
MLVYHGWVMGVKEFGYATLDFFSNVPRTLDALPNMNGPNGREEDNATHKSG